MLENLTGSTRILGIVGDPVAQVLAPPIWTPLFRQNGMDAVCIPFHVQPRDLHAFLKGVRFIKNLDGLIVTVPHKPAVAALVDKPSERARLVGSVNVLRWDEDGSSCGDILDGIGFVNGLAARGKDIKGKRAIVVGSGGVGSAIAFALAESGVESVSVCDIEPSRAHTLCTRLRAAGYAASIGQPLAAGFDIVVNATPLGMKPNDPLPLDCTGLNSAALVCDAVMHPPITRLLERAASGGCFVQSGTYLLDYQLQSMAQFFGFDMQIELPQAMRFATFEWPLEDATRDES